MFAYARGVSFSLLMNKILRPLGGISVRLVVMCLAGLRINSLRLFIMRLTLLTDASHWVGVRLERLTESNKYHISPQTKTRSRLKSEKIRGNSITGNKISKSCCFR